MWQQRSIKSSKYSAITNRLADNFQAAIILMALFTGSVFSQSTELLREVAGDTVLVEARRSMISQLDLASSTTYLDVRDIRAEDDLSTLLARQQGIFIKDYGGDEALHTISMRGLGAEHTTILLDGIPLATRQLGSVNASHLPLERFQHIEIYRGGNSTVFGSGALGGAINLLLDAPSELAYRASASLGRYRTQNNAIYLHIPHGAAGHSLNYSRNSGRNDYQFLINDQTFTRRNSDFRREYLDYYLTARPGGSRILLHLLHDDMASGSPQAINSGRDFQGNARLTDVNTLARLKWELQPAGAQRISIQGYLRRAKSSYDDPDLVINNQSLQSRHRNEDAGLIYQHSWITAANKRFFWGLEGMVARVVSSELSEEKQQRSLAIYSLGEWPLVNRDNFDLTLISAIRGEVYSDIDGVLLPRAGLSAIHGSWQAFSAIGRNFRAPTFNDRYWAPGGNPDLLPERSTSYEAGIKYTPPGERLQMEIALYHLRIKEMIRWLPGGNGIWSPENIDEVRSRGIEFNGFWLPVKYFETTFKFKHGLAEKVGSDVDNDPTVGNRLPFLPKNELTATAGIIFKSIRLGGEYHYNSFRYATLANNNGEFLPAFSLVNLRLDFRQPFAGQQLRFFARINNLFQNEFQYIRNYPLPLQKWRVGITIEKTPN